MGRLDESIEELAGQVASGLGLELDGVRLAGQGRRTLLRITVYKEGGVGIADCTAMSRDMSAALDVEELIGGPYTLEVSSPGLDTPLTEPKHFRRHMGKKVRVTLQEKGSTPLTGTVADVAPDRVSLRVGDETVEIPYADILKAMLEIEIK